MIWMDAGAAVSTTGPRSSSPWSARKANSPSDGPGAHAGCERAL